MPWWPELNEGRRKGEFRGFFLHQTIHTHMHVREGERREKGRRERKRRERRSSPVRRKERVAPEMVLGEGDRREAGNVHGRGREC